MTRAEVAAGVIVLCRTDVIRGFPFEMALGIKPQILPTTEGVMRERSGQPPATSYRRRVLKELEPRRSTQL